MGNRAGVDWASEKHDVLVCGAASERVLAATLAHDEAGLSALCRRRASPIGSRLHTGGARIPLRCQRRVLGSDTNRERVSGG